MPNTAFGRKCQRRFLRCDALSGKAAVSRPAMSDTKFFRRTILLSLRIFPVFSTPRAAFTTARTVNEAVAAAFPPRFCLPPNDLKQQSCSRCCVDFRKSGRFAQVARFHHGASIAARTDFSFDIRFPTGSTVQNSVLTRFVFYSSPQVTARARGRRFIRSAKHDTCCLNFICRSAVSTDISSTNAKGKTTPQSIMNGKTRYSIKNKKEPPEQTGAYFHPTESPTAMFAGTS